MVLYPSDYPKCSKFSAPNNGCCSLSDFGRLDCPQDKLHSGCQSRDIMWQDAPESTGSVMTTRSEGQKVGKERGGAYHPSHTPPGESVATLFRPLERQPIWLPPVRVKTHMNAQKDAGSTTATHASHLLLSFSVLLKQLKPVIIFS